MKILIVGSGGREHALAWKIAQSPRVSQVYIAPGNGGTFYSKVIKNILITDINDLAKFAIDQDINITVVGPEVPLSDGIVDVFRSKNLKIFGPTKSAARLESSKDFAKEFMVRNNIPTAKYSTFTDVSMAKSYVQKEKLPIVIKADGLAAGKGVVIAQTIEEAYNTIDDMIGENENSLKKVVIEEYLVGEEASFIVMSDGKNIFPLATSQDHKRLKDGDNGPNTGGMGAYSPANLVTPDLHCKIMEEVIIPTIKGMSKEGNTFTGFLYAGIMIGTTDGSDKWVKTLEFNCRMGDPETQPIMMRMKSDFIDILDHAINGTLDKAEIIWDDRFALGVVLAAYNYPENPRTGDEIKQLPLEAENMMIFHAGTKISNGLLKTNGGRVMCVTALGDSVKKAREIAYDTIAKINFNGMQYRKDIGWRAIK